VTGVAVDRIVTDVYSHDGGVPIDWGVLIPRQCGVVWEIQTNGVMCDHVNIEGVFIPLPRPKECKRDLLEELRDTNYHYRDVEDVWERIKAAMHFDFEVVKAPLGEPPNQEGLTWVRFTEFEDGWEHGAWVKQLIGRTVALIYPTATDTTNDK
jgi:hypothetical protein